MLARVLRSLLSLVVPPTCLACADPADGPLCRACRTALPWLRECCPRCALPRPCGPPCPAAAAPFGRAWAPLAFDGPARSLVHALKFRGALAAADAMAAQIAANAPPGLLADGTLVPVPADPARRRRRGFDHAGLLARALARRARLPLSRCLSRPQAGERQLGRDRAGRLRGPGEVVARNPPAGTLVLVDDVHTTGATLTVCALALRAAGAERVIAATYARTLR